MKVTVKTLSQKTIEVEIDENKTVRDLKVEIAKVLGAEFVAERQKLICAGVMMDDDKKISEFNISANKFIVVMMQRDPAMEASQNNLISANNSAIASTTQIVSDTESLFLTGEDYKQAVDIMVEIGFDRDDVEHAMAASYNNPERAFEYLTNGIPENLESAPSQSSTNAANSRMINTETVNQVLELLRQNPNLLTATLQEMGVTNSQLLEQIQANPDAFFNLMRQQSELTGGVSTPDVRPEQVITPTGLEEFRRSLTAERSMQVAGVVAAEEADRATAIERDSAAAAMANFTPADRAAIERLKAMGFQETMAVQAYIAFDKNEALAANFLASNVDDDS